MEEHAKTYNTRDLLNAEVVELATGSVLGTVIEAILSVRKSSVEYLGVLPAEWYQPGLLLRTGDIMGFDESVLLVPGADRLLPYYDKQIKKDFVPTSGLTRLILIDQQGQVYGRPVGAVFDRSGLIVAMEAEKDLVVQAVQLAEIVAVGDRYVVIRVGPRGETTGRAQPRKATPERGVVSDVAPDIIPAPEDDSGNGENGPVSLMYRERQIRYMLGKPAPLTLSGRSGQPVITSGETITSAVVNRLIEEGLLNQVFIALTVDRGQLPPEEGS